MLTTIVLAVTLCQYYPYQQRFDEIRRYQEQQQYQQQQERFQRQQLQLQQQQLQEQQRQNMILEQQRLAPRSYRYGQ